MGYITCMDVKVKEEERGVELEDGEGLSGMLGYGYMDMVMDTDRDMDRDRRWRERWVWIWRCI